MTSPISEGVIVKLRAFFLQYPNSKPRTACRSLHLDPRRYGGTARVVKSQTRKELISRQTANVSPKVYPHPHYIDAPTHTGDSTYPARVEGRRAFWSGYPTNVTNDKETKPLENSQNRAMTPINWRVYS